MKKSYQGKYIRALVENNPYLAPCEEAISHLSINLIEVFEGGGVLYVVGNGGSHADAQHFAAEILKGFLLPRSLGDSLKNEFRDLPYGLVLGEKLQRGLPVHVLGLNTAFSTAYLNDQKVQEVLFAQELFVCASAGDGVLCVGTSGASENLLSCVSVARVLDLKPFALTGPIGEPLAALCDVAVKSPGSGTSGVQENHIKIYHAIASDIEEYFFA